jgi:hypothetical protein
MVPVILQPIDAIRRNGLIVPGGWNAHVIQVEAHPPDFEWLVNNLVEHAGLQLEEALRVAYQTVQERYTFGYTHGLRMSVIGFAEKYIKEHPHTVVNRDDGQVEARGFDPSRVQAYYLPGNVMRGRDSGISGLFEEMAK